MSKVVEKIFKTESVKDIITVFALIRPLPALDGMFNRYRREAFVSGEFAEVYGRLFKEGVLVDDGNLAAKGPNWKAPQFFIEHQKLAEEQKI